jgi:hypothetical protein
MSDSAHAPRELPEDLISDLAQALEQSQIA